MKLPKVKSCFYIFSIETGSLWMGFLEVLVGLLGMIAAVLLLTDVQLWTEDQSYKDTALSGFIILFTASLLQVLFAVSLITGVFMRSYRFITPWFWYSGFNISLHLVTTILNGIVYFSVSNMAVSIVQITVTVIFISLKIYMVLVVHALYRELQGRSFNGEQSNKNQYKSIDVPKYISTLERQS